MKILFIAAISNQMHIKSSEALCLSGAISLVIPWVAAVGVAVRHGGAAPVPVRAPHGLVADKQGRSDTLRSDSQMWHKTLIVKKGNHKHGVGIELRRCVTDRKNSEIHPSNFVSSFLLSCLSMECIKHSMKNCIYSTTHNATDLGAPVPVTGVQAGGRAALLTGIISHGHGWLPDIPGKTDRHPYGIPNITFCSLIV